MLSEDIKTKVWGITELKYLRRWVFARVKGFSWGYPSCVLSMSIGIGIGKGGGRTVIYFSRVSY